MEQYTLYAIMENGSRYRLRFDDYYLRVLLAFVNGVIDSEVIKIMNTLTIKELDFLCKVTNGKCDYYLLKSKDSKVIRRVETKNILKCNSFN